MTGSTVHERAIARWLAHGSTSLTHPVLEHAFSRHFHALGIEADWLEAEPFSALESGHGEWWLRSPRWNPSRIDRSVAAAADFAPLIGRPGDFRVTVDSQGVISIVPARSEAAPYPGATGDWDAVRHTVRASHATEAFLYAAAGLILADEGLARCYADGRDPAFCEAVAERLEGPEGGGRESEAAAPRA